MSTERKRRIRALGRRRHVHGSPAVAALRRKIGDELASAEQVVATLSQDLARYRSERQTLARDRDRLRKELAQVDVVRLERADAESLWRTSLRERRQVEQSLRGLEEGKQELAERCAELDGELLRERKQHQLAKLEIACLEEQVEELQSIVDMLSSGPDSADGDEYLKSSD